MKTGGEKHHNHRGDDWDLLTPPEAFLSPKAAKKARKQVKKDRVKEYKRRARRIAKQITRLFTE